MKKLTTLLFLLSLFLFPLSAFAALSDDCPIPSDEYCEAGYFYGGECNESKIEDVENSCFPFSDFSCELGCHNSTSATCQQHDADIGLQTACCDGGQTLEWDGDLSVWVCADDSTGFWEELDGDIFRASGNVGIGTDSPPDILSVSYSDGTHLNIYDDTERSRITIQGNVNGAGMNFVDLGGATDDKWLAFVTDGGISKFESLDDDAASRQDNILTMDMGNGFVGIGTDDPESALHVVTDLTSHQLLLRRDSGTSGTTSGMVFSVSNYDNYNKGGIFFERTGFGAIGDLHFATTDSTGVGSVDKNDARITITSDGSILFSSLTDCETIKTDSSGLLSCDPDDGGGSGAVTSVFTRTGDITAASGDYDASQIDNTPSGNITANTVQGAINELDGKVGTLTDGQWCTTDGSAINCTSSAPSGTGPWTEDASYVYYNGTNNVGIGTSAPSADFEVDGTVRLSGIGGSGSHLTIDTNGDITRTTISGTGSSLWNDDLSPDIYYTAGNVGIGTMTPSFNFNAKGLDIAGTGGQINAPQDGTEIIPTLRITDTVTDYGSGTATIGEIRGGIEFYSSETSLNFPAVASAIYDVNESVYNSGHGLAFYTNDNSTAPSEAMRITADGKLRIPSLADCDTIDGTADGTLQCGEDDGGSGAETDPEVDQLDPNKWCTANADGDAINCQSDAPTGSSVDEATVESYIFDGDTDDLGYYFINSAGTSGQVWTSDGSGRGTWTTVVGSGTDDQTAAEVSVTPEFTFSSSTNVQDVLDDLDYELSHLDYNNMPDITSGEWATLADGDDDTIYTHPTGDGYLHVPATGTTNNGKVLTAGATAGSLSWQTPTGGSSVWQAATGGIHYSSGNVGIGTATPGAKLHVASLAPSILIKPNTMLANDETSIVFSDPDGGSGDMKIVYKDIGNPPALSFTGGATYLGSSNANNMIKFTDGWTGYPDSTYGAEISNDTSAYQTLMIVGNRSGGGERRVKVWDTLSVSSTLNMGVNQEIVFADNGQIRSSDNNHGIFFHRSDNQLEIREYGHIILNPSYSNSWGNVGIGTTDPAAKLHVVGGSNDGSSAIGGVSSASEGAGVSAYGTAVSGFGLYAQGGYAGIQTYGDSIGIMAAGSSYAGYFTGNLYVSGNCSGGGTCNEDIAETWLSEKARGHIICGEEVFNAENKHEYAPERRQGGDYCTIDPDFKLEFEDGDVVCMDTKYPNERYIKYCNGAYDSTVISVVSYNALTKFGPESHPYPIGLAGNVPVKVICDNPIKMGDPLVTSDIPGYAMKLDLDDPDLTLRQATGTVFAKALQDCDSGTAVIRAWLD